MSEAEVERMNALAKRYARPTCPVCGDPALDAGNDCGRDECAEKLAAFERGFARGQEANDYRARWNPEERFRLYLVPRGKTPDDRIEVVATKTWEGIGPMLRLMIEEGEVDAGDRTAVLDTSPWEAGYPGTWVVGSLA